LKDLARNWRLTRSVSVKVLKMEKSTFGGRRLRMLGKRVDRVRRVNGAWTRNTTGS
jgi:hypothetical protein